MVFCGHSDLQQNLELSSPVFLWNLNVFFFSAGGGVPVHVDISLNESI